MYAHFLFFCITFQAFSLSIPLSKTDVRMVQDGCKEIMFGLESMIMLSFPRYLLRISFNKIYDYKKNNWEGETDNIHKTGLSFKASSLFFMKILFSWKKIGRFNFPIWVNFDELVKSLKITMRLMSYHHTISVSSKSMTWKLNFPQPYYGDEIFRNSLPIFHYNKIGLFQYKFTNTVYEYQQTI